MNSDLPTASTPEPLGAPPAPPEPSAPPPPSNVLPPSPDGALERLVADFRQRQRRTLWTEALLWGAAAAVLSLVAAGYVGQPVTWLGRALLALVPLAVGASLLVLGHLRARRQIGDARRSSATIGALAPTLGDDALSAVELRGDLAADGRFSHDLARAFLADVDRRASSVRADALIDSLPVRRAGLALLAVLFVATVALVVWPRPWVDGMAHVLDTLERPAAVVRHEPITGDIELTYKYPAYTGLQARTVQGTTGEISAPAGTEVSLKTRSDRPVRRAELVINGQATPLQIEGERDLRGSFVLEKPGSYHFRFRNALGAESARGPDLPLNVEADAAPKVEIQVPQQEIEIDPGEKVSLRFEATDDFGITGMDLVFRTPGGKEHRAKLSHEDGRRTKSTYSWDLGTLKLNPGDRISYHVEARDNDAVAGAKRGVSRTQVVRIYSAAEHRREARRRAEELWERLVTQLADRIESGDLEQLEAQRVQGNLKVDEAGVQLASDLLTTASEIAKGRDAPEELVAALVTISESYGRTARNTRDIRRIFIRYSNRYDLAGDFGRRLQGAVRDEVSELEKDVLYLESLIDRRKLEELRDLARELDGERRELASLMDEYQKTKDSEVREQILEQISELRRRIDELSARMAELASTIRDEHLNAEALEEMMQEQDMTSQLDEIEKLMREGKTDEAMKKLQELAMQMEEMLQNLEEGEESFGEDQYPELAEKFGEFARNLEETAEQQKSVAEQTKELRDSYREKMKERLAQKGDALREELLEKVEKASRDYQELDAERLGYSSEKQLQTVQSELENVRNALKVEDYDLAAEAAARAERSAEELREFGRSQAEQDQLWGNPPEVQQQSKELAQQLSKDAQQVREVNQALQQLFPPAGQMMSKEDAQKLQQLSKEQGQLQQRAQGLQQQMEELGQMAPIFDEEAMQQMEQVGERMGQATEKMNGRDPARGYGEQQAALDQLQQFQKNMQNRKSGKGKGQGLPFPMMAGRRHGSGMGNAKQDVEIPDEEQYQAPKEFRKDILDAMKQGAPEKYREQVKRYYEELVR